MLRGWELAHHLNSRGTQFNLWHQWLDLKPTLIFTEYNLVLNWSLRTALVSRNSHIHRCQEFRLSVFFKGKEYHSTHNNTTVIPSAFKPYLCRGDSLSFLDVLVGGSDQDPGSQPSHLSPSRNALLQSKISGGRGGNQGRILGRS